MVRVNSRFHFYLTHQILDNVLPLDPVSEQGMLLKSTAQRLQFSKHSQLQKVLLKRHYLKCMKKCGTQCHMNLLSFTSLFFCPNHNFIAVEQQISSKHNLFICQIIWTVHAESVKYLYDAIFLISGSRDSLCLMCIMEYVPAGLGVVRHNASALFGPCRKAESLMQPGPLTLMGFLLFKGLIHH